MWALCRSDHGITWDEFQQLTLANVEALEDRRNARLRHERFNAGVIASAIINVNLSSDSKRVSPFDFVPGYEDGEDEDRRNLKQSIATLFCRLPDDITPEEVQALKQRTIQRLKDQGVSDVEALFSEVFPDL